MADLLIKNLELPKDGFYEVTICGSGRVFYHPLGRPDESKKTEATELADHGDLIDRDQIKEWLKPVSSIEYSLLVPKLDMIPVVIPKSGS